MKISKSQKAMLTTGILLATFVLGFVLGGNFVTNLQKTVIIENIDHEPVLAETSFTDSIEKIDNEYSASNKALLSKENKQKEIDKINSLTTPESFTFEEKEMFYGLIISINSGVYNGETTKDVGHRAWNENVIKYLRQLGYEVDVENKIISWK